jgi:hypothetical protein
MGLKWEILNVVVRYVEDGGSFGWDRIFIQRAAIQRNVHKIIGVIVDLNTIYLYARPYIGRPLTRQK